MATRRLTDRILDLDTLEVLQRIAEAGSLSRAAEALGVTQQAVSARLRVAERAIGQPLVHRSTAGSLMTDTGRILLELASPVLEASRHLEAGVAALREPTGSLVVAASQTIAELLLPRWLLGFRQRTPDVRVRLIAGNSATALELVRSGVAQLGFIETPTAAAELSSSVITEDELAIVVAPDHPWARTASISAEEVARTPLLTREEGSGTRATLEAWLRDVGLTLATPAAVLETTAIIRANARAGIAPAVMSIRTVEADLAARFLVRVPVHGPALVRPLRAIWSGRAGPTAAAFLEIAHELR
ncbi:molybdate transport repressor ModE-like protein [Microbacterium sp. AG157]|uniref:LysR family transcriptional regulator n=1 Tax=Microbacterium sp. AG157 TaxID=2183993 RepID=UPI000E22FB21|nr:LysR family transcriptional regulator [Microbacterium sp. AG157]REC97861.1 molybdate transport repressor ModE-like protein [Microbacterium sp. AG157]